MPGPDPGPPLRSLEAKDKWQLVFETANITSWQSGKQYIQDSGAHVVGIQEHHLCDTEDAEVWVKKNGFKPLFAPAAPTAKRRNKGGVALLVHEAMGLRKAQMPECQFQGRLIAGLVQAPGHREMCVIVAYLWVGEGLSRRNLGILSKIGEVAIMNESHTIVMGDFNVGPSVVAASGFLQRAGMTMLKPEGPTFFSGDRMSLIDYGMATDSLAKLIMKVQVRSNSTLANHRPVTFTLNEASACMKYMTIKEHPIIPAKRIIGPIQEGEASFDDLHQEAQSLLQQLVSSSCCNDLVDEGMRNIYKDMVHRMEFGLSKLTDKVLPGNSTRGEGPKVVWRSVLPEKKQGKPMWGSFSRPLRWLRNRLNEARCLVLAVMEQGGDPALHYRVAGFPEEVLAQVPGFAVSCQRVMTWVEDIARIIHNLGIHMHLSCKAGCEECLGSLKSITEVTLAFGTSCRRFWAFSTSCRSQDSATECASSQQLVS